MLRYHGADIVACILHVSLVLGQDQHESKTFSTPVRYSTAKTAAEQESRRYRGPISEYFCGINFLLCIHNHYIISRLLTCLHYNPLLDLLDLEITVNSIAPFTMVTGGHYSTMLLADCIT